MFNSYIENPQCLFENQDPDEKILLLLRAHPITNLSWIIPAVILFLVPFVVLKYIPALAPSFYLIPQTFIAMGLIINYLLVLIIIFQGFLYWYFNATLITNHKIIDIDFEPVLYKAVDLAPLSKIEETDSQTLGILGTVFNFGNVAVQTAGAKVAIEMRQVPRPARVADLILDLAKIPHQHQGDGGGI